MLHSHEYFCGVPIGLYFEKHKEIDCYFCVTCLWSFFDLNMCITGMTEIRFSFFSQLPSSLRSQLYLILYKWQVFVQELNLVFHQNEHIYLIGLYPYLNRVTRNPWGGGSRLLWVTIYWTLKLNSSLTLMIIPKVIRIDLADIRWKIQFWGIDGLLWITGGERGFGVT